MKIYFLFFILLIIIVNSYITRDISNSCKEHKNASIKNCGVFSINDDYRCCFSSWSNSDINSNFTNQNRECIYLENKIKIIKEVVKNNSSKGLDNFKIHCSSYFLNNFSLLFLLFIIL